MELYRIMKLKGASMGSSERLRGKFISKKKDTGFLHPEFIKIFAAIILGGGKGSSLDRENRTHICLHFKK